MKPARPVFLSLVFLLGLMAASPARAIHPWLEPFESGDRSFEEFDIGRMKVFYHPRAIGEAIVELDQIVYQFDRDTGELLAKVEHWREDLPDVLPELLCSREQAESMVDGEILYSRLYYIDPESGVFPIHPSPENPCWVVRSVDESRMVVTIVDAVGGTILGNGIPPPYNAFSLTGPWDFNPCDGSWQSWSENARDWFNTMGYSTEHIIWPTEAQVQGHVQSTETALFYELAHGGSTVFSSGCESGQFAVDTESQEILGWILPYEKMRFTFVGSCDGMCGTGPGHFAYEFRKGLDGAAVVGYCGMSTPDCDRCWSFSINWQNALFDYMNQGYSVKDAFDMADADYTACRNYSCMRFSGDENFAVLPIVQRGAPVWAHLTSGPLDNVGNGRGVAWGDYDNDGDLDLYLANHDAARPNKLMRNDGGDVFVNATTAPLGDTGPGMGVAWGDYDNDGDLDLYLSNYGSANRLFRNQGGGTFADVTSSPLNDAGNGAGVAWVDYDLDGDLDLYLANGGQANRLFRNDVGSFADATTGPLGDTGNGTGVAWGDYDSDGDPDLYLANYGGSNRLLRNDLGVFTDVTAAPLNDSGNGMGVSWGDYDLDGDLDLYLSNDAGANKLFRNDGGSFADITSGPLGDAGNGASVGWGDYDNDGDLDIYLANDGGVNRLFRNDGGGTFVDATSGPLADTRSIVGLTWGDYDNDGDLDLYLSNGDLHNSLVRNDLNNGNHFLQVHLVGTTSNWAGIGARVTAVSAKGTQIREITGGSGYLCQNSLTAEFGLGSATQVDHLQVTWPSGIVQHQYMVAADQTITIIEQLDDAQDFTVVPRELALRGNFPNPFNPATVICYELPKPTTVTLRVYDVSGRLVRTLRDDVTQTQGSHAARWNGQDDSGHLVASGVYFYCLEAEGKRLTSRMVLTK